MGTTAPLFSSEEGLAIGQKVWDELAEKLESIQPGVMSNI